jgi:hypothetical protein
VESLLVDAGIRRADLDDPDARTPCAAWGAMFRQVLELRPMRTLLCVTRTTKHPFYLCNIVWLVTETRVGGMKTARPFSHGRAAS